MTKREGGRTPNLRSSIYYSETDGLWHGWVTMGSKPDGQPDRRHRKHKDEHVVTQKVRKLEGERDTGKKSKVGRDTTVAEWITTWLTEIAPRRVSQRTIDSTYTSKARWIMAGLGAHRLKDLAPEHLDQFYTWLAKQGLKPNTILQVHRILSRVLKVAMQRGKVGRNVATLVDPPTGEIIDIEPLDQLAAGRVLKVCERRRNGARWSVALALGVRQGEALGLRWDRLKAVCGKCGYSAEMMQADPKFACAVCGKRAWHYEAEAGWQIQQDPYRHGCGDVTACTVDRHRQPCPQKCAGHHRETCRPGCEVKAHRCPQVKRPCPKDCKGHGRECPQRTGGQWRFVRRKGVRAGRGVAEVTLALPGPLVKQLRAHHAAQAKERLRAGEMWEDHGLVFANPDGRPINPRGDYDDWHAVLRAGGVREARVHDARHTAATLLLAQGVDVRTVQQILGHSSLSQTQRYTHVTQQMGRDAADRMGTALWG